MAKRPALASAQESDGCTGLASAIVAPASFHSNAMNTASLVRLLLLSAIWGASFLFMRIGVPFLGPSLLIFARVGFAAVFLLLVGAYLRKRLQVR
jgi:hypothetical protein